MKNARCRQFYYNEIKKDLIQNVMNEFWNNIARYPRFFISSLAGLILVILTPFRNLFKIKKFQFIIPLVGIFLFALLYAIIRSMTGV
jgi:hypothetical protein